jgi:hypothetical protein
MGVTIVSASMPCNRNLQRRGTTCRDTRISLSRGVAQATCATCLCRSATCRPERQWTSFLVAWQTASGSWRTTVAGNGPSVSANAGLACAWTSQRYPCSQNQRENRRHATNAEGNGISYPLRPVPFSEQAPDACSASFSAPVAPRRFLRTSPSAPAVCARLSRGRRPEPAPGTIAAIVAGDTPESSRRRLRAAYGYVHGARTR